MGRAASGGELSRILLALEAVVAASDPVATLVFDEVDAGVGGQAAIEVGRRLARLARHRQVLCVTHLAQVAAFADRHLLVTKQTTAGSVTTRVVELTGATRVRELSRMLGGLADSESAQEHARELLQLGAASGEASRRVSGAPSGAAAGRREEAALEAGAA
jgi:DNA repair protein RecN (Recombination protein N)